jgi:phosphoglycerol transferase
VLPTIGHRIPAWRVVESRWSVLRGADPNDPTIGQRIGINEKYYNALGVIASAGFLFLCLALLAAPAAWLERLSPMADLAKLNIAGVLLGSGFALLFEYFVPQIRTYNRIAVYLAFFSLFAAALLFDRLGLHNGRSPGARALLLAALGVATTLGLLDEIPGVMRPDHQAQAAAYAEERQYVRAVEALLEPGALVFELPYVDYPEPVGTQGYELFRPYLHSSRLRFSYGASRGTKADRWQSAVAGKELPTMVSELCRAGFTGLHVDLRLAEDKQEALRAELDRKLGPPDVAAKKGHWRFYRLPGNRVAPQ